MDQDIVSFFLTEKALDLLKRMVKKKDTTRSMFIKLALADYIGRNFGDFVRPSELAELIKDRRKKEERYKDK